MQRTKWIDRNFVFDFPEGWIFNILERLQGTPVRIQDMIKNLSQEQLTKRIENAWSIQEHIGHLLDLEELHARRIDDFIERKEMLQAADMSNAKTVASNHNNADIQQILKEFKKSRDHFINRLNELDDETQKFQSIHPRLKIMMRPVDMAYFTAEHDDHHLASMRNLLFEKY